MGDTDPTPSQTPSIRHWTESAELRAAEEEFFSQPPVTREEALEQVRRNEEILAAETKSGEEEPHGPSRGI